nr:MAK10-like protein [Tanacetum cinerariifolium]
VNFLSLTITGDKNQPRTLRDYSKPSHKEYRNTIVLPEDDEVSHFDQTLFGCCKMDVHFTDSATRPIVDHAAGGKIRDKSAKESWEIIKGLALYDNESWNDPHDLAKLVKAISWPHDVMSTSDRRLIELKNQVQRMMEAQVLFNLEKVEEEKPETPKVEEKEESNIFNKDDKSSDNETCVHETNIREEKEWIEYKQTLDLVNILDE